MAKDIEFVPGMYINRPTENNKHFLFGKIDITRKELGNWLRGKEQDKIKIDIKYSPTKVDDLGNPKLYLEVDDEKWKTKNTNFDNAQNSTTVQSSSNEEPNDSIPF